MASPNIATKKTILGFDQNDSQPIVQPAEKTAKTNRMLVGAVLGFLLTGAGAIFWPLSLKFSPIYRRLNFFRDSHLNRGDFWATFSAVPVRLVELELYPLAP